MSPVVKVAAASAPPRNSSNNTSSKARLQSARSYLHKQYLKARLNRLQKHHPKGGLKSTLIRPSAWRECMEIGYRRVFRYSSTHEKTLPDGSLRCRMEPHRAPHARPPNGHGRPRAHSLREILNAIFYLLKSGCQWRLLPHDFPTDGPPSITTSEN